MNILKDLTKVKEMNLPEAVHKQTLEIHGNLGKLTIIRNWIDVTTHDWESENYEDFQTGMRNKVLGPVEITLYSEIELDNLKIHEFKYEGMEPVKIRVFGTMPFYNCVPVFDND